MTLRRLVKCASLFCIIFLMCPKRVRLNATPVTKKHRVNNKIGRFLLPENFSDPPHPLDTYWPGYHENSPLMGVDDEPGFDLTDEEISKFKLWADGNIPYYIDVPSFNDKVLRDRIRAFLSTVNTLTRINFVELPSPPKDDETRWVFFVNRRSQLGCADHSVVNLTDSGVQPVILGYDCIATGGELAEAVLAIAGVPAQHNAPNRDEYIQIIDKNIAPGKKYLFQKLRPDEWLFHDLKYDFYSAGHYHYHKHSINGQATIVTKEKYSGLPIGESNEFSNTDIMKLRMLYNYIVKKSDTIPECDKLFKKGETFNKDAPVLSGPKPRKPPAEYHGVEQQNKRPSGEKDGGGNKELKGPCPYATAKASSHEIPENHYLATGQEQEQDEYSLREPKSNSNMKEKPNIKHKKTHDPLTYLSDYQTDENRRRKQQKINAKGVNEMR